MTMKTDPDVIPAWARWLMPSVEDILFLAILLWILGSYSFGLLSDADTGMHIRTGDYILSHWSIPKGDIFSYTKADQPWIVHSWLAAVLFALIHRWLGLDGVALLSAFTISLTFVLLFRFLIRRKADLLTAVSLVILAASTTLFYGFARPHIFTTLLALIWYDRLDRYKRDGKAGRLILLPLLMVLWVNLHGGYLTGFILLVIFLTGEILDLLFLHNPIAKDQARIRVRSFASISLVCLLASFINPYGYKILTFPFIVASNSYIQTTLVEWLSPSFHRLSFVPFELALLLLIVGLGWSSKRTTTTELGVILFWTHAALYSARHIPIFAVIVLLVMGSRWTTTSDLIHTTPPRYRFYRSLSTRLGRLNHAFDRHLVALSIVLSILGLTVMSKPIFGIEGLHGQFNSRNLPVQAAAFIKEVGLRGNMFNPNEFGGYLIYALFPDYKVFVDGRADMYGEAFMKRYARLVDLKPDWRDVLDQYQVNWIICHTYYKSAMLLSTAKDWKLIYSDGTASIFVRDVPENQALIHRFPDVKLNPSRELDLS
jgi:hypothetical protein